MKKGFRNNRNILCFFIVIFFAVSSLNVSAQGNLLITPKRIVFEGAKRSAEINLANIGKDTATYLVSWIQFKMDDHGKFEQITDLDSTQKFADKNVRLFPRKVTLGPNEAQSIKLQVIKKNELGEGEYRSHLFFRALDQKPLGEDGPSKKDSSIAIRMTPVFGISIPVIIHNGETSFKINFSDASFSMEKDTIPELKITFNRTGNVSSYGDLSVDHISADGKITRVGLVKGIAVYSPNSKRIFSLPLDKKSGVDYKNGKLHVTYFDQTSTNIKLAEQDITL